MAEPEGKKAGPSTKRSRLTYFFFRNQLHKKLFVNRGKDLLIAWNYPAGKKETYDYSTVLRLHKKAYTTTQVAQLLNRHKNSIDNALRSGMIERPQFTYGLNENRKMFQYMWREEDIMDLHEAFASVHIGRPRKDGEINSGKDLPTPRELRAMLNNEQILYVKQGDTFMPSWRAREF